jgi:hypothetical protein
MLFIRNTNFYDKINSVQFILFQKSVFGDTASRYRTSHIIVDRITTVHHLLQRHHQLVFTLIPAFKINAAHSKIILRKHCYAVIPLAKFSA